MDLCYRVDAEFSVCDSRKRFTYADTPVQYDPSKLKGMKPLCVEE
jgi:hypothetical protein